MGGVRAGMVSLLFPGQGSQYVGMGREIFLSSAAARAVFESADRELGFSVSDMCFNGPGEKLNLTQYCQPAVFTAGWACRAALEEGFPGFRPAMAAGHSLGELTALVAGGALGFKDGLRLVQKRGALMAAAGKDSGGSMCAVIKLELEKLREICRMFDVSPANMNCPGQVVVSGRKEDLSQASEHIKSAGGKVIPLKVAGAFHSPFMKPAAEAFGAELEKVEFKNPGIPVYSNVTAAPHKNPADIRQALIRQLYSPVLWQDEILRMGSDGADAFIEAGPGKVLSKLAGRILPGARAHSVEDAESLQKTADFLP